MKPPDATWVPLGKFGSTPFGNAMRLLVRDTRCANRNHSLFFLIGPPKTAFVFKGHS